MDSAFCALSLPDSFKLMKALVLHWHRYSPIKPTNTISMYLPIITQQQPQNNSGGHHSGGGSDDEGKSTLTSRDTNDKGNAPSHGRLSVPRQGADIKMSSTFLGNINSNDSEHMMMMPGRTIEGSKANNDTKDATSMFWTDCEQKRRKAERLTNDLLAMKRKVEKARVGIFMSGHYRRNEIVRFSISLTAIFGSF
jgi:hypothetical protein